MPLKPLSRYRDEYTRNFPTSFCPGCGNGTILNCFVRAIDELGISKDKVLCVSGIGCSAWISNPYFNGDALHTTHGRALAFATGAKVYNSDLTTVVFTGDGDGAGIGGNHLIHAARRNVGITTILVNNMNYAMTGGQIAPTTPFGEMTATSPYGNPESPFDIVKLAAAAGATFVARWTTYNVLELTQGMKEAIRHRGFSLIEVLSQCPTQQRRMFDMRDPLHVLPGRLLEMFSESTYIRGRAQRGDYKYAIPKDSPEKSLDDILGAIKGLKAKARIVDHMGFGRVVRVDALEDGIDWDNIGQLSTVKRVVGQIEGKIELGVFVNEEKPEFTDSLHKLIHIAEGE